MSERARREAGLQLDGDFERFVRVCSVSLYRTALLLAGDRSRAEDLLQLALLRTARRWANARNAPEAYARRVLVNLSRDHHRLLRRRVAESPLEGALAVAAVDDSAAIVAERHVVLQALRELPARQREVVVLRFYLDLSVAEAADVLDCSEGTVKSYSARAIARLRTLLSPDVSAITVPPEASHGD